MPEVELQHGNFSWVDLVTNDPEGSVPFYERLFGWSHTVDALPQGNYHMFQAEGRNVAGMVAMPPAPDAGGFPPVWMSYVLVDDLDATVARCPELGGTVPMAPRDIMEVGRMCVIQDPAGGALGLWQAGTFVGADLFNEPGALTWNELVTPRVEEALAFYGGLLGWGWQEMPMDDGSIYQICTVDGRPNGGVMKMTADWPEGTPPYWGVYFQVDDVDDSHGRALELGATQHVAPEDLPVGRLSVVSDPAGAVFSLFKPAPQG